MKNDQSLPFNCPPSTVSYPLFTKFYLVISGQLTADSGVFNASILQFSRKAERSSGKLGFQIRFDVVRRYVVMRSVIFDRAVFDD